MHEKPDSKVTWLFISTLAESRDALTERLQSVNETISFLYNRMVDNIGYGKERLKDVEE